MSALIYSQKPLVILGNQDSQVSDHLKVWISDGESYVCGVISEGTARELQVNWDSPFEGASAESGSFATPAALNQELTGGNTLVTQLNTVQTFKGIQPHTFSITINLYALKSAEVEVVKAIAALEGMALANLNENVPLSYSQKDGIEFGKAPKIVMINIGRNALCEEAVIESVSTPLDGPVDINGFLLRTQITLNIQSKSGINKSDVGATFGAS